MSAAPAPVQSSSLSGSAVAVRIDEAAGLDVTTLAGDATRATPQLPGEMDSSKPPCSPR